MRTTLFKILGTTGMLAATLLTGACNSQQSATSTAANTTEVTPTETESGTVSDGMVTNIDAAAPSGGADENNAEPMPSETTTGNAL